VSLDVAARRVRVLFFVEGFTDIRFVVGLSQICDLTMIVAARPFRDSSLAERVAESGATLRVIEIPGGRLRFQIQSLGTLWRQVGGCDLILSQEVLRGSLNANIVGRLAEARCDHGHLAPDASAVATPPDWTGHVVAGQHSDSYGGDHQRPTRHSLPRDGTVPSRGRVRLVRAERYRAVLWRGRRSVSSR
jgi:hypothetical protein